MELRSIGYMEVSSVARNTIALPRVPDPEEAIAALPRPDLSQMIPYKPKVNPLPGEHPVPGKLNSFDFLSNTIVYFYIYRYRVLKAVHFLCHRLRLNCAPCCHHLVAFEAHSSPSIYLWTFLAESNCLITVFIYLHLALQ